MAINELIATYREAEDLISGGAYQKGTNPKIDRAVDLQDSINEFLKQKIEETSTFVETLKSLESPLTLTTSPS